MKKLFFSQRLAVLATQGRGQPYGNIVAFAATADLKHLLFATTRSTRKYANLSGEPRVAMVVDNRSNQESDFREGIAVTATGVVRELEGLEREERLKIYLAKHPYLEEFVTSPSCALLQLEVETYYVVSQFQNVVEIQINRR
ncbi:MAG: pyridoxamine 5'-phosphate oxidase family protein [candidate division NC10 bacterium]|nr:pyridoxamine 5'-phosphate oxidase family protein [candidate division NC10 bacterium]